MTPWNLIDLDRALRAGWAADTCSPDDQANWQQSNPAWGHCDITALIVNDVFGGDLMVGEVHLEGTQHGFHWWNRLPSGVELDLTREQFQRGQTITAVRVVERPPGPLPRRWEEYLLLRERVIEHLGSLPEPVRGCRGRVVRFSGTAHRVERGRWPTSPPARAPSVTAAT
ncbi:YunG family protein [Streptomyces sp. NPDC055722]